MNNKIEVIFSNCDEIRMGSPFNICEIELRGAKEIVLNKSGWQDKYCWSKDYKNLCLIKWNGENNIPSFNAVLIDVDNWKMYKTNKIDGCCAEVSFKDDTFFCRNSKGIVVVIAKNGEIRNQ